MMKKASEKLAFFVFLPKKFSEYEEHKFALRIRLAKRAKSVEITWFFGENVDVIPLT